MEYKLVSKSTPVFDRENQILSIRTEMEGIIERVATEQIDFKDECVRKALIALGWTPPPSSHNNKYTAPQATPKSRLCDECLKTCRSDKPITTCMAYETS